MNPTGIWGPWYTVAKERICKLRANPSIQSQISSTYWFPQCGGVFLAGLLCAAFIPQKTTENKGDIFWNRQLSPLFFNSYASNKMNEAIHESEISENILSNEL